jgi:hypothetical protein
MFLRLLYEYVYTAKISGSQSVLHSALKMVSRESRGIISNQFQFYRILQYYHAVGLEDLLAVTTKSTYLLGCDIM